MRVAYVVGKFPNLSETFVRDEILFHLRTGIEVEVVSLVRPDEELAEAIPADLVGRVHYADMPEEPWRRVAAVVRGEACWGNDTARRWARLHALDRRSYGPQASRLALYFLARAWERLAQQFDVVHCHFGDIGTCGAALKDLRLTRGRIVTTFHGRDMSADLLRHGDDLYRFLFRTGDLFLPVSHYWMDRLAALGCPPERIVLHRMGVECDRLRFRERRAPESGPVRLVSLGRLTEKKGHLYTIRALAALRRRRPDLAWRLELVGDGPELKRLRALVRRLDVSEAVSFHGALSHAEALRVLHDGAIFVLPSVTASDGDMEGIPVALMEAMALGLPVVSTRHSGIPELVEHGVSGLLSHERDVSALSEHIEWLLDRAEAWPAMGCAGRRRVEQDFDRTSQNRRLVELYQQLTGRSGVA